MRLIQVLVRDDRLGAVTSALDDEGIDYVRQRTWVGDEEQWLLELPVPTDAVGFVLDRLRDAGVDEDRYATITSLESAMTPRAEALQDRFADDFDPLTSHELRSKARDLSRDTRSFLVMIVLSASIAVAGLLIGSPAVVVGSMVIAPIVGPVLTAAVGAVTGDREMWLHSVWIQAAGIGVAIVSGGLVGLGLQLSGYFPSTLDISSIDLIALRVAPNFVTVLIGLASGAAAAYGLATKGPTSLIGVMIAAALIPAAATVGIATAWTEYRIAVGSLLLLLLTMVLINAGAVAVLRRYYATDGAGWLRPSASGRGRVALVGTVLALAVAVAVVGVASYQQVAFERTVNAEVRETLEGSAYNETRLVTVRTQYSGGLLGEPETVTVHASRTADGSDPPRLAADVDRQITAATGREVAVRVYFRAYQRSNATDRSRSIGGDRSRPVA